LTTLAFCQYIDLNSIQFSSTTSSLSEGIQNGYESQDVQILKPPHIFRVADLSKLTLNRRKFGALQREITLVTIQNYVAFSW
jgi:hypothetical protein